MGWKATMVAGTSLVLAAASARAEVVTTPVITGVADGGFTCHVVNASASRQRIKILIPGIVDGNDVIEVLPGGVTGLSISSDQGTTAYCRVVSQGRKDALRASFDSRTQGFPRGQTIAVVQGE